MSLTIRQGDAYDIEVALWTSDGTVISPDIVDSVELVIGSLRKTYPGLVTYDDSADVWLLPLEQDETFRMQGLKPLEARVKFTDGDTGGKAIDVVNVRKTTSREEL